MSEAVSNGSASKFFLTMGAAITALAALKAGKAWERVPYEHMGVVLTNDDIHRSKEGGDAPKIKPSGRRMKTPFMGSIVSVDCRKQRNHVVSTFMRAEPTQTAADENQTDNSEGKAWAFAGSVHWRVSKDGLNPYRSLREAKGGEEFTQIVTDICLSGLRATLETAPRESMRDEEFLNLRVFNRTWERLLPMGVAFESVLITDLHLIPAEILASSHKDGSAPTPQKTMEAASVIPDLGIVA